MWQRSFDPWREMNRIQSEMNRLFDTSSGPGMRGYPAVNLWSADDTFYVTAELPGYDPQDVNISLTADVLRIHGSRKAPECKDDECFHRQERKFGDFDREIQLPFLADSAKVNAAFENGVLTITLPRAEADKPKKIDIKVN
jgi:HSP20 family protein